MSSKATFKNSADHRGRMLGVRRVLRLFQLMSLLSGSLLRRLICHSKIVPIPRDRGSHLLTGNGRILRITLAQMRRA